MVQTIEPGHNQIDVVELAEQVVEELDYLDSLRAVGYYSHDDYDTIYLRDDAAQEVVGKEKLVEDAVLESIGLQTIEDYVEDDLRSTIRFFDTKVILYACAAREQGVVVSVDWDPALDYKMILFTLEDAVKLH